MSTDLKVEWLKMNNHGDLVFEVGPKECDVEKDGLQIEIVYIVITYI